MPLPRDHFVRSLDRNYCTAAHLIERLDEIRESILFPEFHAQLSSAIQTLEERLFKIDQLYKNLETTPSFTANGPLISFLEYLFSCLPSENDGTQYHCLLDYIATADILMAESARLATLSLSAEDKIQLSEYCLYDILTLKPLVSVLEQAEYLSQED